MNPFNRNAALWIVIVLLLALLYSVFQGGTTRSAANTISYSDFVRAVEQRQVQDVRIQGNTITGTFREPRNGVQKFGTYVPSTPVDEKRSLPRDAQRAFMQVVMSAEHELGRAQQKLRETLGATDGADARSLGQLFVDRAKKERHELEQRIEAEVQATLSRVRAPIVREMEAMRGRLEKLGEKLDALRARRK